MRIAGGDARSMLAVFDPTLGVTGSSGFAGWKRFVQYVRLADMVDTAVAGG